MLSDYLQLTFLVGLLSATVRMATPLVLSAMGELVAERSGILNMGVEGTMLMGAFGGFMVAWQTSSLGAGCVAAMVIGGFLGFILAVLACTFKVDQVVTGLAINLVASGISLFWYRVVTARAGITNPTIQPLQVLKNPFLTHIPFIGEIVFTHNVLTYVAFLMVPMVWLFLYRTKYGMEIRFLGENPQALDMKGVNIILRQYLAVVFGGIMAGLGGAFLTLGKTGLVVPEISAGRGWLAIIAVIAGNWRPVRVMFAALIFALLNAFQLQVQAIGVQFPYQVALVLPYVMAIVVLILTRTRSESPSALGVPYRRE